MSGHVRRALEHGAGYRARRVRWICRQVYRDLLLRNRPHEKGPLVISGLKAQIADFERQQLSLWPSITLAEHYEQQARRMKAHCTEIRPFSDDDFARAFAYISRT